MTRIDPPGRDRAGLTHRELDIRRVSNLIRVALLDECRGAGRGETVVDERELVELYRQPRDVVREALWLLVDEGLLVRRRGVGTSTTSAQYQADSRLPPPGVLWGDHLAISGLSSELLAWNEVAVTGPALERIDHAEGEDTCLCIEYLLMQGPEPIAVITNYLRHREALRIEPSHFTSDYYSLLDLADARANESELDLGAAAADRLTSGLLRLAIGAPVLRAEQVIRNVEGDAINFAIGYFRPEFRFAVAGIARSTSSPTPPSPTPPSPTPKDRP